MAGTVTMRSIFDVTIVRQAIVDAFRKLTPRRQVRNPVMFVVYVGSILTTLLWVQAVVGTGEARPGSSSGSPCGSGSPCSSPTSPRRWRRDAGRPRRPRCVTRVAIFRPSASDGRAARDWETVPASALRKGDRVLVEAGDFIPADGTVVEGVASVNEAAITGESAPVIRESGGDRSSVTGAPRCCPTGSSSGHRESRRGLPRPDDLAGGGRQAAEDSERDRARHPARGPDDRLSPRDGDAAAVFALQRPGGGTGGAGHGDGAGGAARLPDPDHDRRAALRDRHRRDGPDDPEERHRDVGPGSGGRGRRGRAPARQDRHRHPRQSPGHRVLSRRRASRSAISPTPRSSPPWPTRRRRDGASWCSPRRSTGSASARSRNWAPLSSPSPRRPA